MSSFKSVKILLALIIYNSVIIWSLVAFATRDNYLIYFIIYSISNVLFLIGFFIWQKYLQSKTSLPKHTNYTARILTYDEQLKWRGEIKDWIEENFGAWAKQVAYIHIESGVITVAFPYHKHNVTHKFDKMPDLATIEKISWRVCLGVYIYNPERMYLFPDNFPAKITTNISIIRDIHVKNPKKVKHYFELVKLKMNKYL
jgi:hypothetical protein